MLLLQLSDIHVTDPDSAIARYASGEARLTALVAHLEATGTRPDAAVLTGDLVDHGTPEEYERLVALLGRLPCPWYPVPGNHDRRGPFDEALLGDHPWAPGPDQPCCYVVDNHDVRLVALDSTRPDHHDGAFDAERLGWLDDVLGADPQRPTVVFTHHPPVDVGLWHMDYGGAHRGGDLEAVVSRHPQVAAVVCGHVHRRLTVAWGATLLCCAPSMTFLTEAMLDDDATPRLHAGLPDVPLYRWIDGRFTVDTLDWHPGRHPIAFPDVMGEDWPSYEAAARSGTLPRAATGH